jgi:hypothetical protein
MLLSCGSNSQPSTANTVNSTNQASPVQESTPKPTANSTYSKDLLDRVLLSFIQRYEGCAVSETPKNKMFEIVSPYVTDDFKNAKILVALYTTVDEAQNRKPDRSPYDKFSNWDGFKGSPKLYQDIASKSEILLEITDTSLPTGINNVDTSITSKANLVVNFKNTAGNDNTVHKNRFSMTVNYKYVEDKEKWLIDSFTIDSIDDKKLQQ